MALSTSSTSSFFYIYTAPGADVVVLTVWGSVPCNPLNANTPLWRSPPQTLHSPSSAAACSYFHIQTSRNTGPSSISHQCPARAQPLCSSHLWCQGGSSLCLSTKSWHHRLCETKCAHPEYISYPPHLSSTQNMSLLTSWIKIFLW